MNLNISGNSVSDRSRLALGCEVLGGTDWGEVNLQDAIWTVQQALINGIHVFDTADVYGLGRSEEVLSDALGKKRSEVTICSKFGVSWRNSGPNSRAETFRDCRAERVSEALESSLRRLKLDCLPL
jgi:myo-inositol catabolism protein IolS